MLDFYNQAHVNKLYKMHESHYSKHESNSFSKLSQKAQNTFWKKSDTLLNKANLYEHKYANQQFAHGKTGFFSTPLGIYFGGKKQAIAKHKDSVSRELWNLHISQAKKGKKYKK